MFSVWCRWSRVVAKNERGFHIQTYNEIATSAIDEHDNEEDNNENEREKAQDQSIPSHTVYVLR